LARPLVPEHVAGLPAYRAGVSPQSLRESHGIEGAIKLSSNENPWGPSQRVVEAIAQEATRIGEYPLPGTPEVVAALAAHHGVGRDQLVVGNGSDELIDVILRALMGPGEKIVASEATFIRYVLVARANKMQFELVPMRDRFFHDLPAIAERVNATGAKVAILVNPSNPTGTWFSDDELRAFFDAIPDDVVVILDEAYFEMVDSADYPNSLPWVARRPRTVIQRTFSKAYGLAGVRVGYAITSPEVAEAIFPVRPPFSVNRLAQVAAVAALADVEHLQRVVRINASERVRVTAELQSMGLVVAPSQTNFLLVDVGRPGADVFEELLQKGVIVRPMAAYGFINCLRISLGTPEQNDQMLSAVSQLLSPAKEALLTPG